MTWRDEMAAVDWAALGHAYGSAGDIPAVIEQLTVDVEASEQAQDDLWAGALHQGTIYTCTMPTVRVLGGMLAAGDAVAPADVLMFLASYADSVSDGFAGHARYQPDGVDLVAFEADARAALAEVAPVVAGFLGKGSGAEQEQAGTFFLASPEHARDVAPALLTAATTAEGQLRRVLCLALTGTDLEPQGRALAGEAGTELIALLRHLRDGADEWTLKTIRHSRHLLTAEAPEPLQIPDVAALAYSDPELALDLTSGHLTDDQLHQASALLKTVANRSRRHGPIAGARLNSLVSEGRLPDWAVRDVQSLRDPVSVPLIPAPSLPADLLSLPLRIGQARVRADLLTRIRDNRDVNTALYSAAVKASGSAMLRGTARSEFRAQLTEALQARLNAPEGYGREWHGYTAAMALLELDETWRGEPARVLAIVTGVVTTPNRVDGALHLAATLLGTPVEAELRDRLIEFVESDERVVEWHANCPAADDFVRERVSNWLATTFPNGHSATL